MWKLINLLVAVGVSICICFILSYVRWWCHGCPKFKSFLVVGSVNHTRFLKSRHHFQYPLFFTCIDLKELKLLSSMLWPLFGYNCPAFASFYDKDHFKGQLLKKASTLEKCQSVLFQTNACVENSNKILLVTHLRYFGYCFNPVSWYYSIRESDETLDAVVAEVSNTPWLEMHSYVIHPKSPTSIVEVSQFDSSWICQHKKQLHVSPFMEMEYIYQWKFFSPLCDSFSVSCDLYPISSGVEELAKFQQDESSDKLWIPSPSRALIEFSDPPIFKSSFFSKKRLPINPINLAYCLICFPAECVLLQVVIHFEAFRLFQKKVPLVQHPTGLKTVATELVWHLFKPFYYTKQFIDKIFRI